MGAVSTFNAALLSGLARPLPEGVGDRKEHVGRVLADALQAARSEPDFAAHRNDLISEIGMLSDIGHDHAAILSHIAEGTLARTSDRLATSPAGLATGIRGRILAAMQSRESARLLAMGRGEGSSVANAITAADSLLNELVPKPGDRDLDARVEATLALDNAFEDLLRVLGAELLRQGKLPS